MSVFALRKFLAGKIGAMVNLDRIISDRCDRYVFSYHRVLTESQAEMEGVHHSLWITPDSLNTQIKWMKSLGDIVDYERIMDTGKPNDRPLFTITFDDGWKDCYKNAVPILKKHHVPAVFFLTTHAICTGELYWPQDIATKTRQVLLENPRSDNQIRRAVLKDMPVIKGRNFNTLSSMEMIEYWIEGLKPLGDDERQQRIFNYFNRIQADTAPLTGYIMDWDEVKEMHDQGFFFGSHTHNHTILENLSTREIEFELEKSKEIILENLKIDLNSFCYPNGRYSGKEGDILSRCGYLYGFCLDDRSMRHCKDNYYIPRFIVNERNCTNHNYFKLFLIEALFYRSAPHRPDGESK